MDNKVENNNNIELKIAHAGGMEQIGIYFGKFLRMFIYQNDWLMIMMATLVAVLVGFALGGDFRVTREGTLTGGFAVVCVCLWNGSFNSIQVICRERDVIKREHRSGMKIYSYILAHMMYQLLICLMQTIVSVVTFVLVGFDFSGVGIVTPWLVLDVGITLLLITYASDMLSLFISSLVKSTTAAMTIMPFVLIFQLIFSGGMFALPKVVNPLTYLTVSSPGFKALSAEMDVNNLPYKTVTDMINMVDDVEFDITLTGADIIELLSDESNESVRELRNTRVGKTMTVREITDFIQNEDEFADLRSERIIDRITVGDGLKEASKSDKATTYNDTNIAGSPLTVGDVFNYILNDESLSDVRNSTLVEPVSVGQAISYLRNSGSDVLNKEVSYYTTVGEVLDYLKDSGELDKYNEKSLVYHTNLGKVLDKVGRDETQIRIEKEAATSLYEPDYDANNMNIVMNWLHLLIFVVAFSIASIIALRFVDKDKR